MPAYTQWMTGGRSITPTGSEIKDYYPMVATSSAGVQTIGHQLRARGRGWPGGRKYARQGWGWALHSKTRLVRVLLLWAWRLVPACACERLYTSEFQLRQGILGSPYRHSKCPAQTEKSNVQLECRLWVWSWVSACALICTTALRFRHRTMSK